MLLELRILKIHNSCNALACVIIRQVPRISQASLIATHAIVVGWILAWVWSCVPLPSNGGLWLKLGLYLHWNQKSRSIHCLNSHYMDMRSHHIPPSDCVCIPRSLQGWRVRIVGKSLRIVSCDGSVLDQTRMKGLRSEIFDCATLDCLEQLSASSYANNNQLAVMPGDRVAKLEWSRRYLSVLGVENNRLYQLRLQVPENVADLEQQDLRKIMESFQVLKLEA